MVFQHVLLPKDKKMEVKKLFLRMSKSEPLFTTHEDAAIFKSMCPSFLMAVAEGVPDDTTPLQMMNMVLDFIREKVAKYSKQDKREAIIRDSFMYNGTYLRCSPEDQLTIDKVTLDFANTAIAENWDDEAIRTNRLKTVNPLTLRLAYGQIDSIPIIRSQVEFIAAAHTVGRFDDFLEGAMLLALGLQRQALFRMSDFVSSPGGQKILPLLSANPNNIIPAETFLQAETDFNGDINIVLDLLKQHEHSNLVSGSLTVKEVLATFEVAAASLWFETTKYYGSGFQAQQSREFSGFYPHDTLLPSVLAFLMPRVKAASLVINDYRIVQSTLALLAVLGECMGDISAIEHATHESLKLTQGKVTELTPYPIPENLAVAYQEQGDLKKALEYFEKALDGIKTCVLRLKTDAIVLQACLVQSTFSREKALRWAFTYSPHFSSVQQYGSIGPGRAILVQQTAQWAHDLGYSSVDAAYDALMKKD